MTRPSDLTPEERDLAARLARAGGADGPSPALDAAILAAARAATASTGPGETPASADGKVVPLRRRTPKWPLGLGLAASLALAVGIGWKVGTSEHGTATPLAAEVADAAAVDAAAMPASDEPMEAVMLPPRDDPSPAPPPPLETQDPSPPARAQGVDASAIAQGAMAAPDADPMAPAAEAPAAFAREAAAAPAPMAPPAPAAPPSPPPPAAAKASTDAAAGNELDRVTVTGTRVRRAEAAGAAAPAMEVEREDAFDDAPPVSADSPEVRDAWLKRIRALDAAGKADEARVSLREFMRRHPDAELPEDLRKLAATLPAD